MKKTLIYLLLTSVLSTLTLGQTISDIPKTDPTYKSVQMTVNKGYLSLFNDYTFRGNTSISRKEIAVILDKLVTKIDSNKQSLSKVEQQELLNLSKNFKNYLANYDTLSSLTNDQLINIIEEQKIIHHDITKLTDQLETENTLLREDLNTLKKDHENQRLYMWIGIVAAGILGIAI